MFSNYCWLKFPDILNCIRMDESKSGSKQLTMLVILSRESASCEVAILNCQCVTLGIHRQADVLVCCHSSITKCFNNYPDNTIYVYLLSDSTLCFRIRTFFFFKRNILLYLEAHLTQYLNVLP